MPRLKVEAAKPPRSVTMPPPRLMSREWRLAPFSLRACHTAASVSRFLCTSSAPIIISSASSRAGIPSRCGRQRRWVCSSVRMKSLSWGHFAMACVRLFASPSQRITSCLLILLITNYQLLMLRIMKEREPSSLYCGTKIALLAIKRYLCPVKFYGWQGVSVICLPLFVISNL